MYNARIDATGLKIFAVVARAGSINRAARELHTVQSNLTNKLRAFENSLGVRLFERHNRGVRLTSAGERLLPYAERLELLLREARQVALDGDGEPVGELRIGSLETTAALRLPPILADYSRTFPRVDLILQTGPTGMLVDEVLAKRLDGAFIGTRTGDHALQEVDVFEEELVLVTAPDQQPLTEQFHAGAPKIIVFRVGCSYRERLEHLLLSKGYENLRRMELGTLEGILACVAAGIGITLLPLGVVEAKAKTGAIAVHRLPPERGYTRTRFIRRKDAYVSAAMAAFMKMIVAEDRALKAAE
jgi:DNA-binding transcriptional LysR family regulator